MFIEPPNLLFLLANQDGGREISWKTHDCTFRLLQLMWRMELDVNNRQVLEAGKLRHLVACDVGGQLSGVDQQQPRLLDQRPSHCKAKPLHTCQFNLNEWVEQNSGNLFYLQRFPASLTWRNGVSKCNGSESIQVKTFAWTHARRIFGHVHWLSLVNTRCANSVVPLLSRFRGTHTTEFRHSFMSILCTLSVVGFDDCWKWIGSWWVDFVLRVWPPTHPLPTSLTVAAKEARKCPRKMRRERVKNENNISSDSCNRKHSPASTRTPLSTRTAPKALFTHKSSLHGWILFGLIDVALLPSVSMTGRRRWWWSRRIAGTNDRRISIHSPTNTIKLTTEK